MNKHIIPIASGKGGVGKSTVAVNLALALAKSGASVGLMDADVYGPTVPTLLGITGQPDVDAQRRPSEPSEVADPLRARHSVAASMAATPPDAGGVRPQQRMTPITQHGLKVMSMGFFMKPGEAVIWRGPMLHKTVQQFLTGVLWGELDYLLVDTPPGTGDVTLSLCQSIPITGAVIVSTPQDVALNVAQKAIAMFKKLNAPILGIVENMSAYACSQCGHREEIFGSGGARKIAERLGIPFLGEVPLATSVRTQSDAGTPIVLSDPTSAAAKAFVAIADQLAAHVKLHAPQQDAASVKVSF